MTLTCHPLVQFQRSWTTEIIWERIDVRVLSKSCIINEEPVYILHLEKQTVIKENMSDRNIELYF